MWYAIHLLEPCKETHEESQCGEATPVWSMWQGIHFLEPLKQTHQDSCWRQPKPGLKLKKFNLVSL